MKNVKQVCVIGVLLVCIFCQTLLAQSQEVVASAGIYFENKNHQISFTVGETVIETYRGDQFLLTQGFHQPLLWVTELDELVGINLNIKAYPNPTADFVKINSNEELPLGSTFHLYNMQGVLVRIGEMDGLTTEVSFRQLVPANYFLKIFHEDNILKTFKIIKK